MLDYKNNHETRNNSTFGEVPPEEGEGLEPNTLLIEDDLLRRGFTSIPNHILDDPKIPIGARFTYILLLSFAWQQGSCFPGQQRLAKQLGVKERMLRYYLSELQREKLIEVIQRGLGKTNVYVIKKLKVDRQPIADQDRQSIAHPERQPIADKEYSVEKDSDRKDSDHSKYRMVKNLKEKNKGPYSGKIAHLVDSLSKHELLDATHIRANITQAQNLWRESKSSEKEFMQLIREAKKRTLAYSATIRKISDGGRGTKNRAPYFFQVLKGLTRGKVLANFRQHFKSPA